MQPAKRKFQQCNCRTAEFHHRAEPGESSRSQPLFVIVQLLGTPKKYSFKVKRSNRDSSALVRRVDLDKMRGGDLMYLL